MPTAVRRPAALIRRPTTSPTQPVTSARDLVTTATLKRGRVYFFANIEFERDKPLAIDERLFRSMPNLGQKYPSPHELVAELEDLFETVTDSDGEQFEKSIFQIQHKQARPLTIKETADAKRPRRVRTYVEVPERPVHRGPMRHHRV